MNPDTCRIHVDGRIRFEYGTCGREFFFNPQQKYADSKISGYVWTGPKMRVRLRLRGRHNTKGLIKEDNSLHVNMHQTDQLVTVECEITT